MSLITQNCFSVFLPPGANLPQARKLGSTVGSVTSRDLALIIRQSLANRLTLSPLLNSQDPIPLDPFEVELLMPLLPDELLVLEPGAEAEASGAARHQQQHRRQETEGDDHQRAQLVQSLHCAQRSGVRVALVVICKQQQWSLEFMLLYAAVSGLRSKTINVNQPSSETPTMPQLQIRSWSSFSHS